MPTVQPQRLCLCRLLHNTNERWLLAVCWQDMSVTHCRVCKHMSDESRACAVAAHEQAASGGWDVCAATKDSYDFKHRVRP